MGDDLGDPAEGEWLFKEGDVVLGPVAASVLIERIEAGEIDDETPVGREAGSWRPLKEVPYLLELYEQAAEKRRLEAERKVREARVRRARTLRVVTLLSVALAPFIAGLLLGRAIMVKRPWDDSEEWLQRAPPLVDLPPKPAELRPRRDPPRRPPDSEDDKRDPLARAETAKDEPGAAAAAGDDPGDDKKGRKGRNGRRGKDTRVAKSDKKPDKKGDKDAKDTKGTKADKDAKKDDRKGRASVDKPTGKLPETLTVEQVQQGLLKGRGGIGGCLKAEATRNPDMPGVVTLMFTVTEEGRAANIKLKEREVRNGPLAECLVKVVSKLRWPKFTGERKNAEFPFKIKR